MKLLLNWLKDYVDIPDGLTAEQIAHDLTMATVEVEGVKNLEAPFKQIVVGQIERIAPHANADRLKLAITNIGEDEPATIVCGGSNLSEGMWVAVAKAGALVRWHGEGDLVELKSAKIRGVASEGMICAAEEIGLAELFPATEEAEVVDLSPLAEELGLVSGMPLGSALGFDDVLFEIDNKSLTNRPDLWGHYGIARELAAIYDVALCSLPDISLPQPDEGVLKVSIDAATRCSRYLGVLIECVEHHSSPFWMRRRLSSLGQRAIGLAVDLTNYVMFALGQPTHVFDYEKLEGGEIIVRLAREKEQISLLDGKEYTLNQQNLVIADSNNAVALAGVMGGEPTAVGLKTKRILLEAASFEPINIRRTAAALGLRSESSSRFEKGIDAARVAQATSLFLNLLNQIQPNIKLRAAYDSYPEPPRSLSISLSRSLISTKTGQELDREEIERKLKKLGFGVTVSGEQFEVIVPSWRATGDVSIPEDIVEEVARLYGYDKLDFVPAKIELTKAVLQPKSTLLRQMREYLAYSAGMNEIFTYPWVEDSLLEAAGVDIGDCLALYAPPANSSRHLQPSLIPNMLAAIERNLKHFDCFSIFELARVFQSKMGNDFQGQGEALPCQPLHLAGAIVGSEPKEVFLRAKGVLSGMVRFLRLGKVEFLTGDIQLPWAAGGAEARLLISEEEIGVLGLLGKKSTQHVDIGNKAVALFELCATQVVSKSQTTRQYRKLPSHPLVNYELAMIFDISRDWTDIERSVLTSDPLVTQVQFLEEYRGKQVPTGKKSVGLRFVLGDPSRTLTSQQVAEVAEKIIVRLRDELGGELRR